MRIAAATLSPPGPRPRGDGGPAELIERLVARQFRIARRELYRPGRSCGVVSLARQTAMYLQRVILGLAYDRIALRFARHSTTVIYACRCIEDRRDDRDFEAWIASLEETVREVRR